MNISTRKVDGVFVVDIIGRIVLGEGGRLRETISSALDDGERKLLLNMAEVHYLDSAGLGEVIRAYTSVTKQGGRLQLLKLTNKVRDLLLITKLCTVLEVHDDEAEAIVSLNRPVKPAKVAAAV
jgi:anti-sigma B factor antagonist